MLNAQKGIIIKNDDIMYTKLVLAYLLNNRFDESKPIIESRKNNIVNNTTFSNYILSKLDELEKLGITHPDFEKVKELLKK